MSQNETTPIEQNKRTKTGIFKTIVQYLPAAILSMSALFGIYVGMQILKIVDHVASYRATLSAKWFETGFEQLQQMNVTIKEELDLILDQRRENIALQAQIQTLSGGFTAEPRARINDTACCLAY